MRTPSSTAKLRIGGFFEWPRARLERENSRAVADALNDETNALDDVCTILICHCPEVLDTSLADEKFDLVLSGHAHGGQVRIGGQGLWSTSQGFLPKYTSGVNQMGESRWSSAAASAIRSRIRASSTSRNWWSWM